MFKNNTTLKNEVIRYYVEHATVYLEILSNTLKDVLKEYKNEEKIEAIDKLVNCLKNDTNGFDTAFKDLDALCDRENTVFYAAGELSEASQVSKLRVGASEFRKILESLIDCNPENKNEIILLQAQKINLFDSLFKETMDKGEVPDFCYHFYDFTLPEIEGDVIPGQKGFFLSPIVEFWDNLQFNLN